MKLDSLLFASSLLATTASAFVLPQKGSVRCAMIYNANNASLTFILSYLFVFSIRHIINK
jgi:hypothetical protein